MMMMMRPIKTHRESFLFPQDKNFHALIEQIESNISWVIKALTNSREKPDPACSLPKISKQISFSKRQEFEVEAIDRGGGAHQIYQVGGRGK